MNLLGAILYDPGTLVSKASTAAGVMTAFDTTNLRLTFTIPAHGYVRVVIQTLMVGQATYSQCRLGVLDGSTIRGRVTPMGALTGQAATTTPVVLRADFTIPGLTPGSVSWDAAYAIEQAVASTNFKFGGPNDTTSNNAYGGFVFEVWDPQPLTTGLNGGVNVTQFNGSNVTSSSGRPEVNTTHIAGSAVSTTSAQIGVNVVTAAGTAWNSGAITASTIATDAIDADSIKADAVTELQSGLATSAALAGVQSDTNDIQTRLPAALVGGKMDSTAVVTSLGNDVITAASIAADAGTEIANAVDTKLSTTHGAGSWEAAAVDIWTHVIDGTYTAEDVMKILAALAAGKTSITGTNVKFRDLADTTDVIDANMTGSERTTVTITV